jgi:hypothetical protein
MDKYEALKMEVVNFNVEDVVSCLETSEEEL